MFGCGGLGRWLRLFCALSAPALLVAALIILPDWFKLYPWPVRRALMEWLLRGVLAVYWVMIWVAVPGTILFSLLIFCARRRRAMRSFLGKPLLLSISTLMSWVMIEAGAAGMERWIHRMSHLPEQLTKPADGSIEVAVIGESSARGEPFHPRLSIGQIVAWQLEEALPGRTVRANVLAESGVTLERMHQKLEKLDSWPAVMIIYAGHNEFQARYDSGRNAGFDEAPDSPLFHRLFMASLRSPFCRLMYETINKHRIDAPPPVNRHELIDPPVCTPSETHALCLDFLRRLEAIVVYCRRMGTLPVLVIPPGNEAGYEPNRSIISGTMGDAERARFIRDFRSARAMEQNPNLSIPLYRDLLDRQPDFAETHFRLARLLERQGKWADANRHYIRARDNDGLPQRCPEPFQAVYRAVAAKHDAILIDGPKELRAISSHGILDDELFHDGQHPTLRGHLGLARAVLRELRAECSGLGPRVDPPTQYIGMRRPLRARLKFMGDPL